MRRWTIVGTLALALIGTGCAETKNGAGGTPTTSTPAETPQQEQTKHELDALKQKETEGFHNMEVLSEHLKEKLNERAKEKGQPVTWTSVYCIAVSKTAATCHGNLTNHETGEHSEESTEVTIAEDGQSFITH